MNANHLRAENPSEQISGRVFRQPALCVFDSPGAGGLGSERLPGISYRATAIGDNETSKMPDFERANFPKKCEYATDHFLRAVGFPVAALCLFA